MMQTLDLVTYYQWEMPIGKARENRGTKMEYHDNYFEMTCPCMGSNLDKMLQPAILSCLYQKDLHGFMLIRELADNPMFDGMEPDKAGVYRYLKKMEESGTLTSRWEMTGDGGKPRRIFSITDRGRECLVSWFVALKQYSGNLNQLIDGIGSVTGIEKSKKEIKK